MRIILYPNMSRTGAGEENSPVEAKEHYRRARKARSQHDEAAGLARRFVGKIGAAWRSDHANVAIETGESTKIRDGL